MAVYRSDQAQVTFAMEAAQGGDAEMMEGTTDSATAKLTADTNAGSRTLSVDNVSGTFVVGDFVRIGFNNESESDAVAAVYREYEVRRIEAMANAGGTSSNTFTLDRPTSFFHDDNDHVKEVTLAIGGTAGKNDDDKYLTFIPGVYESVTTPDPEMSIEGR